MLFAGHVLEKAKTKRTQYIQQLPEHRREAEALKYSLKAAIQEVMVEIEETAKTISGE